MAALPLGRTLGSAYLIRAGLGPVLTLGNLIALLSIPLAIGLFALKVLPYVGVCYRLTNRRIIVERFCTRKEERSVALDDFDTIQVIVQPGQDWYPAGDLVFRNGTLETFRLPGVLRPEAFRQMCLKAQRAYVGVQRVLDRQLAGSL
ncbi:MAG TPA: PH domain-containing protein, partial [Pirellulales bacterium]|nr:PH domain-containing protein [Pirellulales bacterium]